MYHHSKSCWWFSKWFWRLENEKKFGDIKKEFCLKTIEFGDITIKSVGDFEIKFG